MLSKQFVTLSVDGISYQAAYQEVGRGEPLVFLHGFMGSNQCWRSLIPHLQAHYRCICLEMLGFGDSSKPMIRYDIAKQVAFVHTFRETMQLERITLVGHSLGGWVSAAYAIAYGASVQRLILLAPAGIRDDSFCGRYDALRPLLWPTVLVDGLLWVAQPAAWAMGQAAALQKLRWIRQELNAQPAARSFLVDRLRPEDAIDTVEQEIHQLTMPTLVVAGEHDETIPLWHCETYGRDIANAQLVIIPGADHQLPQRFSTQVAECLVPFLRQTEVVHPPIV